jgi:AmiR/NasT family two-component response regulator
MVADLPARPVVIVFTEAADERLWAEILDTGAHDVLAKPFDAADVLECIALADRAWQVTAAPMRVSGRVLAPGDCAQSQH